MRLPSKNIVIVTSEFPPQPGGIGNHAYHLALYLSKQNFEVQVIADQRSQDGVAEREFDKLLPFQVCRIRRYKLRFVRYAKRIIRTFQSLKKASNVIATGKFSLWNVAFSSLFYSSKTLAVVHGSEVNFKSYLLRKSIDSALKRFDVIIAVSNYTKTLLAHLNRHVVVIPNGINFEAWNKSKGNHDTKLKGQPVLTTVGRVSTRKGQQNVIKCLPDLIKNYPDIHYHSIGIPTEAIVFEALARDLGVQNHITFHGSLELNVLQDMLRVTDVFIMLSEESKTGDVEGFGIAILEANALGLPAIGAKGCGIEDAINDGVSGKLIGLYDTTEFKNALDYLLAHRAKFQSGAISWAQQHDWSQIVKQYIDVIDS